VNKNAIAFAETERDILLAECRALLVLVSRRPGALKLLGLAKMHLEMLSKYKTGRSPRQHGGE